MYDPRAIILTGKSNTEGNLMFSPHTTRDAHTKLVKLNNKILKYILSFIMLSGRWDIYINKGRKKDSILAISKTIFFEYVLKYKIQA